ncbi:hypothetical protein GCM10011385_25470 [Nitratireductor aestuarii]|uniref:Uncharacterized protein n=1 Tax=Nitratireductor aestuarii TaxID=1735103 RepID=A0A916W6M9_9HYPH|nr:hypothetical protein [Nitratireductor aestuarii]GGA70512.1 hypothetical protein GCM10011385_25470 [Nitratireductor aestuarii]
MIASGLNDIGVYDANDMASIRGAVEAVCAELGITKDDQMSRERIASNIMRSWEVGHRTPLGLVKAGLDSFL